MKRVLVLFALSVFAGCRAHDPVPVYRDLSVADSLNLISRRSQSIHTISGDGSVTLSDGLGKSVRLDSAFVFAPPDRARIRAWKFSAAVLDLIVLPDAIYLYAPRDRDDASIGRLRSSSAEAGRSIREWLGWLTFDPSKEQTDASLKGSQLMIRRASSGGQVECAVDRATLTPRKLVWTNEASTEKKFTLLLSDYVLLRSADGANATVWPRRIEAVSDRGSVLVQLDRVDLNDAPPDAFKPPARAEKLP